MNIKLIGYNKNLFYKFILRIRNLIHKWILQKNFKFLKRNHVYNYH
jgi:hypothetical protein